MISVWVKSLLKCRGKNERQKRKVDGPTWQGGGAGATPRVRSAEYAVYVRIYGGPVLLMAYRLSEEASGLRRRGFRH